jgi:hypothetical protein
LQKHAKKETLKKVSVEVCLFKNTASSSQLGDAAKIKLLIWSGSFNCSIGDKDFRNKRLFLL